MKRWEIIATVVGSLVLIGGFIGAVLALNKKQKKEGLEDNILYTM